MPRKYDKGYKCSGKYGDFEVLEYVSKKRVLVRFTKTNHEKWTDTKSILAGTVKDPFFPNLHGVGCIGNTTSSLNVDGSTVVKKSYTTWEHMLRRCYATNTNLDKTYKDCSVCPEWLCFENYEVWYDANYKEGFEVDKDLKYLGNRVYSPETCTFIPSRINSMVGFKTFNSARKESNAGLPVGVSYHKRDDVYTAQCYDGDRLVSLGYHENPDEAFSAYREFKLKMIRSISSSYYKEGVISFEIYSNLQNCTIHPSGYLKLDKEFENDPLCHATNLSTSR